MDWVFYLTLQFLCLVVFLVVMVVRRRIRDRKSLEKAVSNEIIGVIYVQNDWGVSSIPYYVGETEEMLGALEFYRKSRYRYRFEGADHEFTLG